MKTIRLLSILLILLVLGASASPVAAADYYFRVESMEMIVFVNTNGSITIKYDYVFVNDPTSGPIEFVDIGLPNGNYDFNYIKADVDGKPITNIESSPYVSPGIALGLGSNSIRPGDRGNVHVTIAHIPNVLSTGTAHESEPYASLQVSTNYFGSEFVDGSTRVKVSLVLPAGMTDQEPRYYPPQGWPGEDAPTESGFDSEGRVYFTWETPNGSSSRGYVFGAAFPTRLVPSTAIVSEQPAVSRPNSIQISEDGLFGFICTGGFLLFFILTIFGSITAAKKRKLQYLPPKIAIEGHGVKRGLTAIEAAVLKELPLDKVMTMVLFSVLKKGAAEVVTKEPLALRSEKPLPEGLYPYEIEFLRAFEEPNPAGRKRLLQTMMVGLVRRVTEKMKGLSRKETMAYYDAIMERAWQQVEAAGTPEVKSQVYDEVMGWTLLDREFDTRTTRTFGSGPVFLPQWWGRFDPGMRPIASNSGASMAGGGSVGGDRMININLPTLPGADFAASMANSIQNFSSNIIGDITGFTGAVTNVTNPPPPPSSSRSGWRGGGGGSCACACACAGCACACAGGGR